MSAPVDVLAVLEQAIEREKAAGQSYVAQEAARAAFAELIAADVEYDTAKADKLATYKRWNQEHDPAFASDEDFAVLNAVDTRLRAAATRRSAALDAARAGIA